MPMHKENSSPTPFNIYDSQPFTGKDFSNMTFQTFRQHPVRWFTIKFPYFLKYWDLRPAIASPSTTDFPTSEMSAVGLLVLAASFFSKRSQKH